MGSKPVHLKLFVDKKNKKVMFADAEQDFVEVLFSFLTLPLGTIARLSSKNEVTKDTKLFGSLNSLYKSVENIDINHFSSETNKTLLINPVNISHALCEKLKINLNIRSPVEASANVSPSGMVFFKKNISFFITDDLKVIPLMLDTSISLLNSVGVECIDLLEEKTMEFGLEEFSSLLKWSLVTNTPLTNMLFGETKSRSCFSAYSSCIKTSTTNNLPIISSNSTQPHMVKLLIQKSKRKVLCAQADNSFVEMLFSFLTISLGYVKHLTMGKYSPTGIDNMYNSISSLGDGKYLKSEEIKSMLLCPKLWYSYLRVTDLLPIYEKNKRQGSFLKEQGTFIVSDDLEVTLSPSISKFNILSVPVDDIEVKEVSIGEQEALLILEASLTSTSALTDCLGSFKNAK